MKQIQTFCLLLFLFIFNSILSKGQDDKKGLYIGITGSPDYCNLRVSGSDKDFINSFNDMQSSKMSYSGGIGLLYRINNLIAIESGLLYSNKGFTLKFITRTIDPDPLYPDGSTIKDRYNFHYLDIPLKVNIYLLKKNVQLFVSGGIAGNILLDVKEVTKIQNRKYVFDNTSYYKSFGVSMLASVGVDLPLSPKTSVRIEPIFRRSLTRANKDGEVKWYLYNTGLNLGLYYKL
ncbi:MAG: PorT family protein [Sporocytophaga sp.]|uniref:porin family protein n=1 Tax=Sporocytophaga sp. TaxID=2231183 RepID=UPI001B20ED79|nr:porin family protein [Sporocytophaga sp.]MBO9699846.1 PorT family protein [Sporocytophaga sp.]